MSNEPEVKARFESGLTELIVELGGCQPTAKPGDYFHTDRDGFYNTAMGFGAYMGWKACERIMNAEIDSLNKLAYMVDQRNEDGEGNTITYKDAYESSSELASNLRKQVKALTEENDGIKKVHKDVDEGKQQVIDSLYERCELHARQVETFRDKNMRQGLEMAALKIELNKAAAKINAVNDILKGD